MRPRKDQHNFAMRLNELNQRRTGQTQITPFGRVFMRASVVYVAPVHTRLVGEDPHYHDDIMHKLEEIQSLHRKLYAGTGGLINFSYMAKSRALSAILFDVNPLQTIFWNSMISALKRNPNREDMLEYMLGQAYEQLEEKIEDAFTNSVLIKPSTLFRTFGENKSGKPSTRGKMLAIREMKKWLLQESKSSPECLWLHDDRLYAHLHKMAACSAIGALTIDVVETEAWNELNDFLNQINSSEKKIGLLYLSNVLNFYRPNNDTDFTGRKINWPEDHLRIRHNLGLCLNAKAKIVECDNKDRPTLLGSNADYFPALAY